MQPGIDLTDATVENDAADDGEDEANDNPKIEVPIVICQDNLRDNLYDVDGLEIGIDHILLLVGRNEQLAVVENVTRHRLPEECVKGKIDEEQACGEVTEPPREKQTDKYSHTANKETNATVEVSQHGHDLIDFLVVVFLQGFI